MAAVGANDAFVSNLPNGTIAIYALPFTSTSSPVTTLAGKRSVAPQAFTARFGATR
jgi:hypothetical protein